MVVGRETSLRELNSKGWMVKVCVCVEVYTPWIWVYVCVKVCVASVCISVCTGVWWHMCVWHTCFVCWDVCVGVHVC